MVIGRQACRQRRQRRTHGGGDNNDDDDDDGGANQKHAKRKASRRQQHHPSSALTLTCFQLNLVGRFISTWFGSSSSSIVFVSFLPVLKRVDVDLTSNNKRPQPLVGIQVRSPSHRHRTSSCSSIPSLLSAFLCLFSPSPSTEPTNKYWPNISLCACLDFLNLHSFSLL